MTTIEDVRERIAVAVAYVESVGVEVKPGAFGVEMTLSGWAPSDPVNPCCCILGAVLLKEQPSLDVPNFMDLLSVSTAADVLGITNQQAHRIIRGYDSLAEDVPAVLRDEWIQLGIDWFEIWKTGAAFELWKASAGWKS